MICEGKITAVTRSAKEVLKEMRPSYGYGCEIACALWKVIQVVIGVLIKLCRAVVQLSPVR